MERSFPVKWPSCEDSRSRWPIGEQLTEQDSWTFPGQHFFHIISFSQKDKKGNIKSLKTHFPMQFSSTCILWDLHACVFPSRLIWPKATSVFWVDRHLETDSKRKLLLFRIGLFYVLFFTKQCRIKKKKKKKKSVSCLREGSRRTRQFQILSPSALRLLVIDPFLRLQDSMLEAFSVVHDVLLCVKNNFFFSLILFSVKKAARPVQKHGFFKRFHVVSGSTQEGFMF